MKRQLLFTIFIALLHSNISFSQVTDTAVRWVWVGGSKLTNQPGKFRHTPSTNNVPGARLAPYTWVDPSGNFWFFGGFGYLSGSSTTGRVNDLWKLNPTTKEWTWIKGDTTTVNGFGTYGSATVSNPANIPGARQQGMTWTDASGNLWLFGGLGFGASGSASVLNDLWKYNPTSNEWTYMHGNNAININGVYGTPTQPASTNKPGSRRLSVTWVDNNGNFWLFGGIGLGASTTTNSYLNDLWKYNPNTNEWTFMKGSTAVNPTGVYTTIGDVNSNNVPGGVLGAAGWKDANGDLWIFGGTGRAGASTVGSLNAMWKYEMATNTWIWMSGDNAASLPTTNTSVFGTRGVPDPANKPAVRGSATYWTDISGKFWLYGGSLDGASSFCSDLWRYDPAINQWAWMKGPATVKEAASYGILNTPDFTNTPGARNNIGGAGWRDAQGNFWLVSGILPNPPNPANTHLNDLWQLVPVATPGCTPAVITASGVTTFCNGDSVLLTVPKLSGVTYEWKNGATTVGSNDTAYIAKTTGSYILKMTTANCNSISNGMSVTVKNKPSATITLPGTSAFCQGSTLKLKATYGTSYGYQWMQGNGAVGTNDSSYFAAAAGNYRVVITDNTTTCKDSSTSVTLTINPLPNATTTPAGNVAFCQNDSLQLQAEPSTAGYTYKWVANNALSPVAVSSLFIKSAGSYYTIVTDGNGCIDTSATVTASINLLPVAQISPSGTVRICQGDNVVLDAGQGGLTYHWRKEYTTIGSNVPTYMVHDSGNYKVIITDGNQCTDSSAVTTVRIYKSPVVTITPADTGVCEGNSATLQINTSDTGLVYQWKKDGVDIVNATADFCQVTQSGNYYVVVSYTGVCNDSSAIAVVTVHPLPVPVITASGNLLKAGSNYVAYKWYLDGQVVNGASDSILVTAKDGSYVVEVIDSNGCGGMSVIHPFKGVDVDEIAALNALLKVFPNPTHDVINISTPTDVQLTLYGMDGRLITHKENARTMDLSNYADGIYILHIADNNGVLIRNERIVKQSW